MKKKIVITGGHVTPALSVIDELKKKKWQIYFFGRRYASETDKTISMEMEMLKEKDLTFIPITAGKIHRYLSRYTLISFLKIPIGFFQVLGYLLKIKPQVILSFGGYLSVPVVFAGWLLRIPIVTHEQTASYGLGSKVNSFFAKRIAISWAPSEKYFPKEKLILTGNPIRKNILRPDQKTWQVFDFDKKKPLIFITGGNQGSHIINQTTQKIINQLVREYNVFHQVGRLSSDFETLENIRQKLSSQLKNRYHCKKYLDSHEMGTFLNKADLVVSRSGANIVTELAALGKPALLIPIPWAYADEQNKNAQLLVEAGTAKILPQDKLTPPKLFQLIKKMIKNLDQYKKNSSQAKKLVKLDAAQEIVKLAEKLVQ